MAHLPGFTNNDKEFQQMQSVWTSILNPVLAYPPLSPVFLKDVVLKVGENSINHLLSRKQQGWIITDQNGGASIYRSKGLNDKTLYLTSDAVVTVSLWVY